ncbi:sodium-dependent glucose transporter 1A-like [Haliotis cracherodii]|uniref:sodium-dependent glucose transporter 1A-like n=1 Tax=Haliotis cracherodii TaxID=6455 RepID=UPI0039E85DA8
MEDRKTRIFETIWLFWAFHLVGFVNGIIGPTLLDLQQFVHASLTQMTYIFFVQGAGFIVGILLAFGLERCLSTRLIMTCSLLLGCMVNFALPWGTVFYYLAIMFFIMGMAKGLVDYAAMSISNQLWPGEKGAPFQFVTLGAGIGAFLAPFLATPFLSNGPSSGDMFSIDINNHTTQPLVCIEEDQSKCNTESRVQYAYVIIGILSIPPVFAFAHYHRKRGSEPLMSYEEFQHTERGTYSARNYSFIALLFLFHIPVFGIMLAYGDLLTPYGVNIGLHLSKSHMAVMTSVFWGCFLLGRILNLSFSGCLTNFVLLCLNFVGVVIACGVLIGLSEKYEVGLWMGTAALGVFTSPYLPMVLAWSADYVQLTGGIITASLVASGLGEILVPFITGQCFVAYGPKVLMYFISGTIAYEIVTFLFLVICSRGLRKY